MALEEYKSPKEQLGPTGGDALPMFGPKVLEALKDDTGKLRYDLVPIEALEQVVQVYTWSARKYTPDNWRLGMKWSKIFAAVMRHLWSWRAGQIYDPESGINHLAHAVWGCFTLLVYAMNHQDKNDLKLTYTKEEHGIETTPGSIQ